MTDQILTKVNTNEVLKENVERGTERNHFMDITSSTCVCDSYKKKKKNADNYTQQRCRYKITGTHRSKALVMTIRHMSRLATDEQQILNIMLHERVGLSHVQL